jgi:hypothetical protein
MAKWLDPALMTIERWASLLRAAGLTSQDVTPKALDKGDLVTLHLNGPAVVQDVDGRHLLLLGPQYDLPVNQWPKIHTEMAKMETN